MLALDRELRKLLVKGKACGYLTYDEVHRHLPDETYGTEKIDQLLAALDSLGIDLVDAPAAKKARARLSPGRLSTRLAP